MSSEEYDLSICLVINIDWWQKFKRTVHSLGGIYAAVLNLPRAIRQKLENIFTLGEFRTSLQGLPLAYHITKKELSSRKTPGMLPLFTPSRLCGIIGVFVNLL